jgi:glycosyltransferase involved in cell wall biosynthesis
VRSQQLRYQAWQWCAFRAAAKMQNQVKFDVVHHITFGVWRHHSLISLLGPPSVFGPLGGGEVAPFRLRKSFPVSYQMRELLRDAANYIALLDPLLHRVFRCVALIPCKTADTVRFIPAKYRQKCVLQSEIGAPAIVAPSPRGDKTEFRVLFAGNLLPWKGVHLALRAVAIAAFRVPNIRFTIAGSGPAEPWLRRLVAKLGIEPRVVWLGKIAQSELFERYAHADVFLFPSLHDSGGSVVLESLSRGLPVVCLDLGGPAQFVDASCGRVIDTQDRTEEQVSSDLAEALCALARDEVLHGELRKGAMRKAEKFSWDAVIGGLYERISELVGQRTEDGPRLHGARSKPEMHKVF